MTTTEIIIEGAKLLGLINSNKDGVITNKVYDENDFLGFLRVAYSKAYVKYKKRYPEKCLQTAVGNNWQFSGLISTNVGLNTIVVPSGIEFSNSHIGYYVYNTIKNTNARIMEIVSAQSVTLDLDVDTTWNGDLIYLLSSKIPFGGDLADVSDVRSVGVKEKAGDLVYKPARYTTDVEANDMDFNVDYNGVPVAFISPSIDSDTNAPIQALQILPLPQTAISNAYQIKYVANPLKLELNQSPVWNDDHHFFLVYGMIATGGKGLGLSEEEIKGYWTDFYAGVQDLLEDSSAVKNMRFKPSRIITSRIYR